MKKLLSMLSALTIAASASLAVISCSVPKTNIDVEFSSLTKDKDGKYTFGDDKDKQTFTKSELASAMRGNAFTYNALDPVGMSFDQLNNALISVVSFNDSIVVKSQNNGAQLKEFRNTFLGRDGWDIGKESWAKDVPSVDGVKYSTDSENYYKGFDKTTINSLFGLQKLYEDQQKENKSELGDGANSSLNEAKKLFGDDVKNKDDVKNFMDALTHSVKNSSFTNITYDADLQEFKSKSKLFNPYTVNDKTLTLNDQVYDFDKLNNKAAEAKDKDGNEKTINNLTDKPNTDPFGALVLKTKSDINNIISGTKTEEISLDTDANKDKSLRAFYSNNGNTVYYSSKKDADKTTDFTKTFGAEYLVEPVDDFKVTYHFESDVKLGKDTTNKDSVGYDISFTLSNLAEIYSPVKSGLNSDAVTSVARDSKDKTKLDITFNSGELDTGTIVTLPDGTKANTTDINKQMKDSKSNVFKVDWKDDYTANGGSVKVKSVGDAAELGFNFKGESTAFTTSQISWMFRGYQFLDFGALDAEDKDGNVVLKGGAKPVVGKDFKDDNLKSEKSHGLKDLKTTGWSITKINKEKPAQK